MIYPSRKRGKGQRGGVVVGRNEGERKKKFEDLYTGNDQTKEAADATFPSRACGRNACKRGTSCYDEKNSYF